MKNKKTAFMAVLLYILITSGIWGILTACACSFNRLSPEKIKPASVSLCGDSAEISVLDKSVHLDIKKLKADSKLYYAVYLLSADETRLSALILSSMIN